MNYLNIAPHTARDEQIRSPVDELDRVIEQCDRYPRQFLNHINDSAIYEHSPVVINVESDFHMAHDPKLSSQNCSNNGAIAVSAAVEAFANRNKSDVFVVPPPPSPPVIKHLNNIATPAGWETKVCGAEILEDPRSGSNQQSASSEFHSEAGMANRDAKRPIVPRRAPSTQLSTQTTEQTQHNVNSVAKSPSTQSFAALPTSNGPDADSAIGLNLNSPVSTTSPERNSGTSAPRFIKTLNICTKTSVGLNRQLSQEQQPIHPHLPDHDRFIRVSQPKNLSPFPTSSSNRAPGPTYRASACTKFLSKPITADATPRVEEGPGNTPEQADHCNAHVTESDCSVVSFETLKLDAFTLDTLKQYNITTPNQIPGLQPIPAGIPPWKLHRLRQINRDIAKAYADDLRKWGSVPQWKRALIEKRPGSKETSDNSRASSDDASDELSKKLQRRLEQINLAPST